MSKRNRVISVNATGLDCAPMRKAVADLIKENTDPRTTACREHFTYGFSFGMMCLDVQVRRIRFEGEAVTVVTALNDDTVYVLTDSHAFRAVVIKRVARPLESQILTRGKHIFLYDQSAANDDKGCIVRTDDAASCRNTGKLFFYTAAPLAAREGALANVFSLAQKAISGNSSLES